MADKLDELLAGVQEHIKGKKSELLALQTQVGALRSAHNDLNAEVAKAQNRLQAARDGLADADNELARRREEAGKIAGDVINAAHESRAKDEAAAREALENAAIGIAEGQKQLKALGDKIRAKKAELQSVINDVNVKRSELSALQSAARRFAGEAI